MWRFTRNNGITEGFHTKMEVLQRQAYGFRNFQNYRLRVRVCVLEISQRLTCPHYVRRAKFCGFGGPGEIRTLDLFHAMEARSQLRHRPTGWRLRNENNTVAARLAGRMRPAQTHGKSFASLSAGVPGTMTDAIPGG